MSGDETRGERNCNPGNVIRDTTHWLGMLPEIDQADRRFCRFSAPVYGIRALCRILLSYQRIDRCRTLAEVIQRYAPKSENDTAAYLADVVARTGIAADAPLDLEQKRELAAVARAIILHENGRCRYDAATIDKGAALALGE